MATNQLELDVNVLETGNGHHHRHHHHHHSHKHGHKHRHKHKHKHGHHGSATRSAALASAAMRQRKKIDHVTVEECQRKLARKCGAGGSDAAVRDAFSRFLHFGRSKTGDSLTFEEFIVACKACGIMEVEQCYAMFQLMDANADGIISLKEFSKVLYGDLHHVRNWNYRKANEKLVETRVKHQQNYVIKTGAALRDRLAEAAAHVRKGEGHLRGIDVGIAADPSSVINVCRRYGIMHTQAALREMLEYMNPEHNDKIRYEDFVRRIFEEPVLHPRIPPPKPNRKFKLPAPKHHSSHSPGFLSTVIEPATTTTNPKNLADISPALRMLREGLMSKVEGPGRLLKTFKQFRQKAGAMGQTITFEDFKVALWRSGIRLPADKARDIFYLVDTDHSGTIEYDEFIAAMFGKHNHTGIAMGDGYARQKQHIKSTLAGKKRIEIDSVDELHACMVEKAREDGGANVAYMHFKHAAQSRNGVLDLDSFRQALRATGLYATEQAARKLFEKIDTSGDGAISYQEFIDGVVGNDTKLSGQYMAQIREDWKQRKLLREAQRRQRTQEVVAKRFSEHEDPIEVLRNYLDRKLNKHNVLISFKKFRRESGASGNAITKPEFAKLLRICGLDLSPESIAEQFARVDVNGDGYITYNEFCSRIFDPQRSVMRQKQITLRPKEIKGSALPALTTSPFSREERIEENDKPMTVLALARTIKAHIFDNVSRTKTLIAKQASMLAPRRLANGALESNSRKRGTRSRMAMSVSDLVGMLNKTREVKALGKITDDSTTQLVSEVAKSGRAAGVPTSAMTSLPHGYVDLWSLIHYVYNVVAPMDAGGGVAPDRVKRWDIKKRANDLLSAVEKLQGPNTVVAISESRQGGDNVAQSQVVAAFRKQLQAGTRSAKAPDERRRDLEIAFESGSTGGKVNLVQFRTAIFRSGLFMPRLQCQKLFEQFSTRGDGLADVQEFLGAVLDGKRTVSQHRSDRSPQHQQQQQHHHHSLEDVQRTFRSRFASGPADHEGSFQRFLSSVRAPPSSGTVAFDADTATLLLKMLNLSCEPGVVRSVADKLAPRGAVTFTSFVEFTFGVTPATESGTHDISNFKTSSKQQRGQNSISPKASDRGQSVSSAAQLFASLRGMALKTSSTVRLFANFQMTSGGGGASIDLSSFTKGLRHKNKLRASPAVIKELFDILDVNGSGRIELDEFVKVFVNENAFSRLYAQYRQRTGKNNGVPALAMTQRNRNDQDRPKTSSAYVRRDMGIALRFAKR